jgi:hypothetical protein
MPIHTLRGKESIRFRHPAGTASWDKPAGIAIQHVSSPNGAVTVSNDSIRVDLSRAGGQLIEFEYTAASSKGLHWIASEPAMARYSRRNQGRLVDSSGFERAFEETSNTDLRPLFQKDVYGLKQN